MFTTSQFNYKSELVKKTKNPKTITTPHDHSTELNRLSRIKGQIDGVDKMIRENRYCPDIAIQIKAIRSALRSLEANIVESHIKHCVTAAIKSRDQKTINKKLEEVLLIIKGQG